MSVQKTGSPCEGSTSPFPLLQNYPVLREFTKNYLVPAGAAVFAIVPTYTGFERKCSRQKEQTPPSFSLFKDKKITTVTPFGALRGGLKAGRSIVMVVAVPTILQGKVELVVRKYWPFEVDKGKSSVAQMFLSSLIIGGLSVVPLAYFNGRANKMTWEKTWNKLNTRQVAAILGRESACFAAWRMAGPLSTYLKNRFEGSQSVEIGALFLTGAAGALAGHPGDTYLTREQQDLKMENPREIVRATTFKARKEAARRVVKQLFLGGATRATTLGVFTILFVKGKQGLNTLL